MREWAKFWGRSVVNGLRWGKTALDHGSLLITILGVLFGVGFVLIPLTRHGTRKHPYHYHFPTFPFTVALLLATLVVLCHGAYVTWKKETGNALSLLADAKAERDGLLAEKAAPKPLPGAHIAELKEMIRSARAEVKTESLIVFGATDVYELVLFNDAISAHYPTLVPQVLEWEQLLHEKVSAERLVENRARSEVEALAPLGVISGSAKHLLKAIDDARIPQVSDWTEPDASGTGVCYWRLQQVLDMRSVPSVEEKEAKEAWEGLVVQAQNWLEVEDRKKLRDQVETAAFRLERPLAFAERQYLLTDTRFCRMCPEEYRRAASDVTHS